MLPLQAASLSLYRFNPSATFCSGDIAAISGVQGYSIIMPQACCPLGVVGPTRFVPIVLSCAAIPNAINGSTPALIAWSITSLMLSAFALVKPGTLGSNCICGGLGVAVGLAS